MKGYITLGIGEKSYEGIFKVDRARKLIVYTFADELPVFEKQVVKSYEKWSKLLPYELGGEIVNEVLDNTKR